MQRFKIKNIHLYLGGKKKWDVVVGKRKKERRSEKMKLKEFYKFTWFKLILFILLAIIPLYFLIQKAGCADCPPTSIFLSSLFLILYWPFWVMLYFEILLFNGNVDWIHLKDIPFIFIALIINIIYLYSIASLISLICNKIFSKKVKK